MDGMTLSTERAFSSLLARLLEVRLSGRDSVSEYLCAAKFGEVQGQLGALQDLGVITWDQLVLLTDLLLNALESLLLDYFKECGLFPNCIRHFSRVLASTSITLPAGQATHVLRHTFASHFVMGGGNILTLQKILGHSSVTMTMRYAHLSPDHLQDALRLNPIFDTLSTPSNVENEKAL